MQIPFLLALTFAFSSLLNGSETPVGSADVKCVWTILAATAVVAFAWWIAQMRRHAFTHRPIPRWLQRAEWMHTVVYVIAMLFVFGWLEFAQIASVNWTLSQFILADELAVAAVLLLPLLASWACLAGVVDADASGCGQHWWDYVLLQVRHTLMLPLIPIILLTAVADIGRICVPNWNEALSNVCQAIVVLLIVLGVPWIVRLAWPTAPMAKDAKRACLEAVFAKANVSISEVLLWDTGGRMANAAVTGILPKLRFLLVSDQLIAQTTDRQLAAVAAHEAGHLQHRHLPRLVLSLTLPILLLVLIILVSLAKDAATQAAMPAWLPILTLAVLGGWAMMHSRLAKMFEHQADGAACRILTIDGAPERSIDTEAVELFSQTLFAIGADPEGDWLHPQPAQRIAKLQEWCSDPAALDRFDSRLKRISRLHTATALSLLAFCIVLA